MSPAGHTKRSPLAGAAYWAMMRRIVIAAGCIDAAWIPMYAWIGSPVLSGLNVISVGMYAAAYQLIQRRRNTAALVLVWLEVLCHAALGSLLIGWDSGFHYFLLMFIPTIVVSARSGLALPLVVALLVYYLGLHAVCQAFAPLTPLEPWALRVAFWVNVCLIFGLYSFMTGFYRVTIVKAQQKLVAAATTDPLTGLVNRAHVQERAQVELSGGRRRGEPIALVLADVDHFKRINDELGHAAGDEVLVRMAKLMRDNLRDIDVLARWGGEEFLALLPASSGASAAAVAERMRQAVVDTPIEIGGRTVNLTMSFGVAEIDGVADLQAATARADQALYISKHGGRNRVTCAPGLAPAPPSAADQVSSA